MTYDLVADYILGLSPDRIARRRLDLAITVLLLLESGPNWTLAYKGLQEGRYRLDSQFVVDLLKTADKKAQWCIVRSPAFAHLPGHLYRRLFFDFWRLRRRSDAWRYVLGWSLHGFLHNNPQEAPIYAKIIWTIASDPDEAVALAGLASTKLLGDALTLRQAEVLIELTHHSSNRAGAAMSNLGDLYKNLRSLKPEVRALLLDPQTIATLRSANPSDGRGKWSCYRWCITNMHKALRRARRGRVPRAVK